MGSIYTTALALVLAAYAAALWAPGALLAQNRPAEPAPRGDVVVVANQRDATVHLVEAETGRRLARIETPPGPHEVAVSGDGRWAVVSIYGDQATVGSSLLVIDVQKLAAARTLQLGSYRRPHDLAFLPGDSVLAVTAETDRAVLLVDVASGRVRKVLPTGQPLSHTLAVGPGARRIYTANMAAGNATEIDVETGKVVRTFTVGPGSEGIAVAPDGSQLWVTSLAAGNVSVFDLRSGDRVATLPAPGHPYRVAITPDGRRALVPAPMQDRLRIFDVATREETTVSIPGAPGGARVSPDGRTAYLPLNGASGIAVVDLETSTLVRTLPAGEGPDGIGVSGFFRRR
jgi:DNA-binding beta-propeller fold protein YncE